MASALSLSAMILLPTAFLIWVILSFTEKRKSKFTNLCDSRPGIVSPINFLNPRHRVAYSLACSAQCSLWLELLIIATAIDIGVDKYLDFLIKAVYLVILVLITTIITYPMVACIDAPIPMIGYGLGLIYCLVFLGLSLYKLIDSLVELSEADAAIIHYALQITGIIPQGSCLVGIIIWYIYKLHKGIRNIFKNRHHHDSRGCTKTLFQQRTSSLKYQKYVKRLFNEKVKEKTSFCAIHYYWRMIDLPLPLTIAAAVSTVLILQLTIVSAFIYPMIFGLLTSASSNGLHQSIQAVAVLGPLLSAGVSFGVLGHLLYSVQKEINELRKGRGPLIPHIHDEITPLKLASSTRYPGYQIASFIIGWIFYATILTLIGFFFVLVCFSPDTFGFTLYILVMTGLAIGVALFTQYIVCKFAFLRLPDNKEKATVVIDNRRLFESFMYFTLLYSVATGLLTSTLRILTAISVSLLVKPRLDVLVFISPFQKLDTGHAMYRSFMITEAHLHNPIVKHFTNIILETSTTSATVNCRPRNRWQLAYTLINNPDLIPDRRQQRQSNNGGTNNDGASGRDADYQLFEDVRFFR